MVFSRHRRLDTQTKWILAVVGPWLLALLAAFGNHYLFVELNDNDSSQYNQFWTSVLKNSWALVVHALLASSADTAFSSMIWTSLPGHNIPIKSLDALLELPALFPALQIVFSRSIKFLYYPVYWSACLATFVFITITPPSALTIQPMQGVSTDIRAPALDLAADPSLYTIIRNNWEYVRPSNRIRRYMRNVLTSDEIFAWDAPEECRYGCTYNITYYAPALRCVDYTPGDQSGLELNETYHGQFNISDAYLALNLTVWPVSKGARRINGSDTTPLGTRCTFHNATYTTKNRFGRNLQNAQVINRAILPDSSLVGIPLGFSNNSCPYNTSWTISNPLDTPSCARIQLNTWALIDAFASSLSGTILVYPQTLGPGTRFANNALLPNLDYLFTVNELSRSFDLAPWVKQGGLGNALEAIFSNATLSLTRDAQTYNWTAVTSDAKAIPFVNRYVYQPSQLWLGYASALFTAFGAGWAGWVARKTGKVPMGESGLSRILATTRDSSFECIGGVSADEVDHVVVRYEVSQAGDGSRMRLVVLSDPSRQKGSPDIEGVSLLQKS